MMRSPFDHRRSRKFGIAACFLGLLLGAGVLWAGDASLQADEISVPPRVVAESAMIIDGRTGLSLYEKNADAQRAVASTQKLLTALVVSEAGQLEEKVEVERTDLRVVPTRVGLKVGQTYSRSMLLQSLLVKSGNDVARCLARDHAGGQEAFREVMNSRARRLGMRHSQFVNPHGLTEEGQYSTARDMAKLAFVAYADPTIRAAVAVKELDFKHEGWTQKLKNTNRLLHGLSFVNGMKTGYTDAAGRCLICSGQFGDREAIAVVLGSNSQSIWNDAESLLRWALEVPETWEETSDAEEDEGEADE